LFLSFPGFREEPHVRATPRFACGLKLDLEHVSHTRFDLFCAWEDLLLGNFNVHDWQRLGIVPPASSAPLMRLGQS
jgi:hypothetical protein